MRQPQLVPRNAESAFLTSWAQLLVKGPQGLEIAAIRTTRGARLRTVVAKRPEQHAAAEELVRRRYAWRGYRVAAASTADARVTLLTQSDDKLLGTLTVRPDSPRGLLAESTYGAAIRDLRRDGHRVGELTKLAVEEGADWRGALDALVQASWLITRMVHALTDVVIEVNPRHARFYERVFGFIVAATGGVCSRVGAPSVLMRLDLEDFGHRLQLAGRAL